MQRALELHQLINVVHRNDDVDVINKEKNLRFLCKNLQFLKRYLGTCKVKPLLCL